MYELTSVLTTIAAASASFVAILGGFIASKLISISAERNDVISKLQDIDEEIDYRSEVLNKAKQENEEDDALDFILEHIEALIDGYKLNDIYESEEHPHIELETLIPYWEQAETLFEQFKEEVEKDGQVNNDYVPKCLAKTLTANDFGYDICKKIGSYLKQQQRKSTGNPFDLSYAVADLDVRTVGQWYYKNNDIIKEQENAIGWLNLQKQQFEKKKTSLQKPKGVIFGLIVFAAFSLFCIVLPLIFSPFSTNNYCCFVWIKTIFLVIFGIGLTSIFGYLFYLLKWNNSGREEK